MKKVIKSYIEVISILTILCMTIMMVYDHIVVINSKGMNVTYIDSIKHNQMGLMVGTSQDSIQSFFGEPIILDISIYEQIFEIAKQDKMLSYSDSILQIGDVRWRVNFDLPNIILCTSVQPDDPKMIQVVKYIDSIYGKPYYDEEDGFSCKWSSSDDSLDIFKPNSTLVHLRRIHSKKGGTLIILTNH